MDKKYIAKRFLCALLPLFMFATLSGQYFAENTADESTQSDKSESQSEESEFNFIKSGDSDNNFFYNDNCLLYGGITLIVISVAGVVLTLNHKKIRKIIRNKRKQQSKH